MMTPDWDFIALFMLLIGVPVFGLILCIAFWPQKRKEQK